MLEMPLSRRANYAGIQNLRVSINRDLPFNRVQRALYHYSNYLSIAITTLYILYIQHC